MSFLKGDHELPTGERSGREGGGLRGRVVMEGSLSFFLNPGKFEVQALD